MNYPKTTSPAYSLPDSQSIRHFLAISLTLPLLLVGCNKPNANQQKAGQAGQQMPPATVNVQTVQFVSVPLIKELSGKVVAYQEAVVLPQISGIIDKQSFRNGSMVRQGQELYRINPDNYSSALAGSEAMLQQSVAGEQTAEANYHNAVASLKSRQAELALAQSNLKRLQLLKNTDAISAQEYDTAVTTVNKAIAAVENAQAQIGVAKAGINAAKANTQAARQTVNSNQLSINRTVVKAPISGVTSFSKVNVGSLATAGQTQLVTISQLNPIYVDISQSSSEMLALRQALGQGSVSQSNPQVQLKLANGSVYPTIGELRFEEAKVDAATGSVNLRAVFDNSQAVLLPGMMVNARVLQGVINSAVLLPQSAINRNAKGETSVNIVDANSKIQVRPVTTQGTYEDKWIVISGLKQGEKVVVTGGAMLKPEQPVVAKPVMAEPAKAATNPAAPPANATNDASSNPTAPAVSNSPIAASHSAAAPIPKSAAPSSAAQ